MAEATPFFERRVTISIACLQAAVSRNCVTRIDTKPNAERATTAPFTFGLKMRE